MTNPTPYQPPSEQRYTPPQYEPASHVQNPMAGLQSTQHEVPVQYEAPSQAQPTEQQYSAPQYSAPQPQYSGSQYTTGQPGGYAPAPAGATGEYNKLALASVIVSGASILGSLLLAIGVGVGAIALFILPLVGAILGHVALKDIKQRGGEGRSLALTGVILGWGTLGVQIVVSVGFLILGLMLLSAFSA